MTSIQYLRLNFLILSEDNINLPLYKGSAVRGGLINAFKRIVCALKKNTCDECLLKPTCVYAYLFETSAQDDSVLHRVEEKIPHPYILEPPLEEKRQFSEREEISFSLVLFGKGIKYLPYFIYAVEEFGHIGIGRGKGKFLLSRVESEKLSGKNTVIYSSDNKILKPVKTEELFFPALDSNLKIENPYPVLKEKITVNFITPTRIVSKGHLSANLEFHQFMRSLLRRISAIYIFHCEGDTKAWDFKGMIENAKRIETVENNLKWHDWERYSTRQKKRMKLGGIKGTITYSGDFTNFMPYIKAGEITHIGKNTSFGLGKYQIQK
jgi:hypothetical protein